MGTALLTDKAAADAAISSISTEGQELFQTFLANLRNAFAGAMGNAMFVLASFAAVSLIFSCLVKDSKH